MFSGRKNQTDLFKRTKAVCLFLTRFIFFYFPNYFLSSIFLSLFLKAHDFLFSFILDHVIVFLTKSEILFSFFFFFFGGSKISFLSKLIKFRRGREERKNVHTRGRKKTTLDYQNVNNAANISLQRLLGVRKKIYIRICILLQERLFRGKEKKKDKSSFYRKKKTQVELTL